MLTYPTIDPVAFHIFPLAFKNLFHWPVYWYGLMYLFGFFAGWALLTLRNHYSPRGFTQDQVSDLVFYAAIGAVVGGRLGYMFFYDFASLVYDPLLLFKTWKGGMSFHGGLLGVLIAMVIFSYKNNIRFLVLTDFIAPVVPIGLGAGRIGNFINGELWGRVTDVSWGMVFPKAGPMPRHPSQLYEFLLEGVLLFIILFLFSWKPRPMGAVSGLFAIFYGLFRITAEFFREPDEPIGYFFGWVTEGQILSVPLILVGILLLVYAYRHKQVIS